MKILSTLILFPATIAILSCNMTRNAYACPDTSIRVNVDAPEPNVSFGLLPNVPLTASFVRTFGTTRVHNKIDAKITAQANPQGCIVNIEVEASIIFPQGILVQIHPHLIDGTCAKAITIEHEMEHVSIARAAQKAALQKAASYGNTLWTISPGTNLQQIANTITQAMHNAYVAHAYRHNSALDLPDNIARTRARCADWPDRPGGD